jgi:hypothetical protein
MNGFSPVTPSTSCVSEPSDPAQIGMNMFFDL